MKFRKKSLNDNNEDNTVIFDDVWRAKTTAWCRKHGFRPTGYSEAWLNDYEEKNGTIFL